MAEYIFDVMSQTSKLDWAFPFQRTGAFPIDRSAVFSSLADAQNYALGVSEGEEAKDERKLGGTSYVGQIISVYESSEDGGASANAYIITPSRGLMKLAATTASGDVSADIAELQGKVATLIADLDALELVVADKADQSYVEEQLSQVAGDLDLKADAKDVEDLSDRVTNLDNEVSTLQGTVAAKADKSYVDEELANKADKDDVYTKGQVYTKGEVNEAILAAVDSAGHLKRIIVEALPEISNADVEAIYMIKKVAGLIGQDYYEEYMVIEGAWEKIGNTFVDLSDYATIEYVDGEIDKVEKSLSDALTPVNEELAKKAVKEEVEAELLKKADKEQVAKDIASAVTDMATTAYVGEQIKNLAEKATTLAGYGITNAYTKDEVNDLLDDKANAENVYSKEEVDNNFAKKATTLAGYGIGDAYTKNETDALLLQKAGQQDLNQLADAVNGKADKAATLAGYGITDAYTKSEADQAIADKISEVNGGESAGEVLGQLNAYKKSLNMEVYGNEDGTGSSRIDALESVGAQANVIESITIEGTALEIKNKAVALPLALSSKAGLVRSAVVTDGVAAENSVSVDTNGYMFVNSVNVNKLVQTAGEYLILNGGAATV